MELRNQQEQQNEYETLLAANRGLRRRLFVVLAVLGGILLLMVAVLLVLHFALSGNGDDASPHIEFFAPYEGNIFEFEEYLGLDRSVTYFDGQVYRSIETDNEKDFDRAVLFLRDFLEIMTRGDASAYNAAFTFSPQQKPFSQQMIYESVICYEGYTTDETDKLIVYRLEYKIHRNDGTLRRDVGSDGMIPQWVVVRVTDGGDLSIDTLTAVRP